MGTILVVAFVGATFALSAESPPIEGDRRVRGELSAEAGAQWPLVAFVSSEGGLTYEFVERVEYYGGVGIKIKVPPQLSKESVHTIIKDAAKHYGGHEEITVWVYEVGDDESKSGFTVAMGEYSADSWRVDYAASYFGEEDVRLERQSPYVGQQVTLRAGATVSNNPENSFSENVVFTADKDMSAEIADIHTQSFGGVQLTSLQVRVDHLQGIVGWVTLGDLRD